MFLELPTTICKNTLYFQKIKSPAASSHMQMHLTAPSGAKSDFTLVYSLRSSLYHSRISTFTNPWQPRLHIWVLELFPTQALGAIGSSRSNLVLNQTRARSSRDPAASCASHVGSCCCPAARSGARVSPALWKAEAQPSAAPATYCSNSCSPSFLRKK